MMTGHATAKVAFVTLLCWGVPLAARDAPSALAEAPVLHAIIVSDQSDWAQWGVYAPNVGMDSVNVFSVLVNHVPPEQLNLVPIAIMEEGSPKDVHEAIAELKPKPRDTLFFYFTGHGGSDDRGAYFDLEKGKLYRNDVRKSLEAKKPRLVVLLSDCCNVRDDGLLQLALAPMLEDAKTLSPVMNSLFFDPRGTVDVNACRPGESAFFHVWTSIEEDPPKGSLFTAALVAYFDQHRARPRTWDQLLGDVALRVRLAFLDDYPKGASVAKGRPVQRAQNVHAIDYPGRPPKEGPRSGLRVRDTTAKTVRILSVEPDSPAAAAVDVARRKVVPLPAGGIVVAVNGERVAGAAQFAKLVAASPRIMRLTVESQGRQRDYLMRMRY